MFETIIGIIAIITSLVLYAGLEISKMFKE